MYDTIHLWYIRNLSAVGEKGNEDQENSLCITCLIVAVKSKNL